MVNDRNYNNNNRIDGAAGGVERKRFQQSASLHSGAGEKETLNINVVGNNMTDSATLALHAQKMK